MPQLLTGGGGTNSTGLVLLPPGVIPAPTGGVTSSSSGGSSSSSRASSEGSASGGTAGARFRAVVSISSDDDRDRIFYEDGNNNFDTSADTLIGFNYYHHQKGVAEARRDTTPNNGVGRPPGPRLVPSPQGSGRTRVPAPPPPPPPPVTARRTSASQRGCGEMAATTLGMPDSTRWRADGSLPKVVAHENGAIVNGYLLVNGTDNLDIAQVENQTSSGQTKRYHVSGNIGGEANTAGEQAKVREQLRSQVVSESTFAGSRDVKNPDTLRDLKIVSSKGTIRGVKNRVRAGIATFLDKQDKTKNFRGVEKGKIVIYLTSMRIIRETHERCQKARMILQTHMVCYEEVDIFMSKENQRALMERLGTDQLVVPQVFADGQHLGGVEELDYMNECGELRQIFENFKKVQQTTSCTKCGGYRFVNCPSCHGSKKSLNRNHFTEEFCALRCVNCDENGLVRCDGCSDEETDNKVC